MNDFSDKTVLITGATGDFGRAFARRFQMAGAQLVLHGRNADKLAIMQSEFPGARTLCFDVTDRKAIARAMAGLGKPVDVLINNAGGALGAAAADESPLDDWLAMIEINNAALVAITHPILKTMVARGSGHIINIGSTAGSYPYPGGHVYCAVKAFVKQFSLALRADTYSKNVRVTNIEPGMVETQFSLVRYKGDQQAADAVYANTTPLLADDVAESVFWAASQPSHVNINRIELMPTRQAPGPLAVDRD
ncbi:MAG: SDR family NAD(P)-dependent oxidoreductase [Rhodospirillales bacterium]|nr:SDR family NAD(P)-dependent oxidoreductase [Rhodospirillales bacterium]